MPGWVWNYRLSRFGEEWKKNIYNHLKSLLKYFFHYLAVYGQVSFIYFNQNNRWQQNESKNKWEDPAVFIKADLQNNSILFVTFVLENVVIVLK